MEYGNKRVWGKLKCRMRWGLFLKSRILKKLLKSTRTALVKFQGLPSVCNLWRIFKNGRGSTWLEMGKCSDFPKEEQEYSKKCRLASWTRLQCGLLKNRLCQTGLVSIFEDVLTLAGHLGEYSRLQDSWLVKSEKNSLGLKSRGGRLAIPQLNSTLRHFIS